MLMKRRPEMKLEVRKIWSKEWMNGATKADVKIGVFSFFGVMFCLGAMLGILLV